MTIYIGAGPVSVSDVAAVAAGQKVAFAPGVLELLVRSRTVVEEHLRDGVAVYGLNRELGAGRNIAVANTEVAAFQRRIIRNHNAALGEPLPAAHVRAIVLARLVGFTRGGSGVRPELAEFYRQLLNRSVQPLVRSTGSVGAADLVQLAAIAAVVIGEGEAVVDGHPVDGATALAAAGLEPLPLAAHEGLAVMSSNAYSVGAGAVVLDELRRALPVADLVVALSLRALAAHNAGGNPSPFDPVVAEARGNRDQATSAERILRALANTAVIDGGRESSTQDHVSFRSAPQLHGALAAAVRASSTRVEDELAARTDNPLVDVDSGRMVSGGNFQAVDLALSYENLRVAVASVAGASERRLAALSRLQAPFRRSGDARVPGLLWYSASAQLAELRHLAGPVTLLGSSLSDDVEDHSAHGPLALQLLERAIPLLRGILAVEALTAADLVTLGAAGDYAGDKAGPGIAEELLGDAARSSAYRLVVDAGALLQLRATELDAGGSV
ncbi:MAG: phenylalanine/histidine ammonia-lyase [Glaciihabitans sp.]|nr:phenylalanine/histidine ammonia-lyase [Glaciihabitans sp.]